MAPMSLQDAPQVSPSMPAHCFDVLVDFCDGHRSNAKKYPEGNVTVGGLFVTWETLEGTLRGCLGSLSSIPLDRLGEYAIKSSQNDIRFTPIGEREICNLTCTVSILHSFETCRMHTDWTIGVHGILVEFSIDGRNHRSTFLPHVIRDQNWSHGEAIDTAIRKSGYNGDTSLVSPTISLTRYQSSKACMTHEQYLAYSKSHPPVK